MPNWCINDVTVSHPDRKVIRRLIRGFKRGRLFSEFMPETLMEWGTAGDIGRGADSSLGIVDPHTIKLEFETRWTLPAAPRRRSKCRSSRI
jgi:hypothetical protein